MKKTAVYAMTRYGGQRHIVDPDWSTKTLCGLRVHKTEDAERAERHTRSYRYMNDRHLHDACAERAERLDIAPDVRVRDAETARTFAVAESAARDRMTQAGVVWSVQPRAMVGAVEKAARDFAAAGAGDYLYWNVSTDIHRVAVGAQVATPAGAGTVAEWNPATGEGEVRIDGLPAGSLYPLDVADVRAGRAVVVVPPVFDADGLPVVLPAGVVAGETLRLFMAGRVRASCGHYMAASERRAGFNRCERCL